MNEAQLHFALTWAIIALAPVTLVCLFLIAAPYGRHYRSGWGPGLSNRLGWLVMELPTVVVFLVVYWRGDSARQLLPLVFLVLWQGHYVYRAFIFPFLIRGSSKPMPLVIVLLGFFFNCQNAYVNARFISHFGTYPADWLHDPRFVVGVTFFVVGFAIHLKADQMLRTLRAPGDSGYRVPRGWLYEYVACPNYLGEIIQWFGFALATWSLPGLAFALYTLANLGPRALSNRAWYRERFKDYPLRRRALVPFLF